MQWDHVAAGLSEEDLSLHGNRASHKQQERFLEEAFVNKLRFVWTLQKDCLQEMVHVKKE